MEFVALLVCMCVCVFAIMKDRTKEPVIILNGLLLANDIKLKINERC